MSYPNGVDETGAAGHPIEHAAYAPQGIHSAALQQMAGAQLTNATLKKLLAEIETANKSKAKSAQQQQEADLEQKAKALEDRVDALLKQLSAPSPRGPNSSFHTPAPANSSAVSGAGYSATPAASSNLRSPVKQAVGTQTNNSPATPNLTAPSLNPVSARSGSNIEMWPHRPQSVR